MKIDQDLHDYIEGIAIPVSADEAIASVESRVNRRRVIPLRRPSYSITVPVNQF